MRKILLLLLTLCFFAISTGCSSSKSVDGNVIEKDEEMGDLPSGGK